MGLHLLIIPVGGESYLTCPGYGTIFVVSRLGLVSHRGSNSHPFAKPNFTISIVGNLVIIEFSFAAKLLVGFTTLSRYLIVQSWKYISCVSRWVAGIFFIHFCFDVANFLGGNSNTLFQIRQ